VQARTLKDWKVEGATEEPVLASLRRPDDAAVVLSRSFEFKVPLAWLLATPGPGNSAGDQKQAGVPATSKLRLRFSLWQNRMPVDSLPAEGWIELQVVSEEQLSAG